MANGSIPAADYGDAGRVLLRGLVKVSRTGKASLKINSTKGLSVWVDAKPVDPSAPIEFRTGTRKLTFIIDTAKRGDLGLRVEVTAADCRRATVGYAYDAAADSGPFLVVYRSCIVTGLVAISTADGAEVVGDEIVFPASDERIRPDDVVAGAAVVSGCGLGLHRPIVKGDGRAVYSDSGLRASCCKA